MAANSEKASRRTATTQRKSTTKLLREKVARLEASNLALKEVNTQLELQNQNLKLENEHLTEAMVRLSEASNRRDKKLKALEMIAHHDSLTGLLDRRGMEIELLKTIKTINREKGRGVVVYLDLDKFKLVNDLCDHAMGDYVLTEIATILRNRLRPTDLISRIGGDEFLLFLQGVDLPVAKKVVEELQERVRGITADHACINTLKNVAKRDSVIDFSAGYSLVESDCTSSFAELMNKAEKDVPKFQARRSVIT